MMKKIMPKKRLISLFAAACILYGCSSAPVSSPKTETTAAIQSEESQEEKTETEETKAEESKDKDSDSEESKNGQEDEQSAENAEERKEDKESESDSETNEGDKESSDKSSDESSKDDDKEKDEKKDKFIQTVKNAHPESFSGCTYGKAFDEFFTSPQWDYFESTNGQDVVEFTGECMYAGSPTKARMQFTVSSSSVVTTGALYYNNAPQTTKIITESLNRIFEQYAKAHDIAYTLPSAEAAKNSQTNALPPETQVENPSAQNTENQNTQSQNIEAQNTENQNMQTQNTETQNTQTQNAPQTNAIQSGGAQAALSFAAWTNPNIGSWHSPSTGYYVIPYIDSAGNPSLRFANANTKDSSATVYYTDAVSAVTNDAGGLTYQAYLYKPSGENQQLVGMVEVIWNSSAELKSFSVKMINGNQAMDNSMAGNDYTFFGATN
jgi:DNA mismatch repair ATPase MutL